MSTQSLADWARVASIFNNALDLPPEEQQAIMDEACLDANGNQDEALRGEVESLLAAHAAAEADTSFENCSRFESLLSPEERGLVGTRAVELEQGGRIGPYRIAREIGRGGMGTVYLAERADGQFKQQVALKLISPGLDNAALQVRFLAERQLLARLQHPNIAHLLDGGTTESGQPYFAMEFVEGEPVTSFHERHQLALDIRLGLFLQVCDAVAYAHRKKVVHRDLKPSNILVAQGYEGEPRVKLLDFGIAKLLDLDSDSAPARTILNPLTPEHAAPEQIRREEISPATDVYALGLILYELLAGQRAYRFERSLPGEIERIICEQEPAKPSTMIGRQAAKGGDRVPRPDEEPSPANAEGFDHARRAVRGDLDTICLKALEKEPSRRYQSAEELADDIRRHQAGRPIEAHAPSAVYRARRFVSRHRVGVAGGLAFLLLGIAIAVGGLQIGNAETEGATSSAVAQRLYEEGLRTLRTDPQGARQLFRAALDADSMHVLAIYQTLRVERGLELSADPMLGHRMRRLVEYLPERERLFMRTRWAEMEGDPQWLQLAENLTSRYPDEPEGHLLLGGALLTSGDRTRAIVVLRRLIDSSEIGFRDTLLHCLACDAYEKIANAYFQNDSLATAEQLAREWARSQPDDIRAWFVLAGMLEFQGKTDAARQAMRQTSPRTQSTPYLTIYPGIIDIRNGDFDSADRLLRELAKAGAPDVQEQALWFLTISLRYQGRLGEARETARSLRTNGAFGGAVAEGQVLFEMGQFKEAAALFDSLASQMNSGQPNTPVSPAQLMFQLTHVADARAVDGDTTGLRAISETIETLGRQTLWHQRRVLRHHVRGLLSVRRGDLEIAEAEFRRAMASPNNGFTRTNLELARVLIALDRPDEAIPILEIAFRGSIETQRLYVTHTELHELLGNAFEETGDLQNAAVHYRWVLNAWRNADPQFRSRRENIRRRLGAL